MIAYFSIKTLRKWFVLSANRWLSYGVFKSSLNYPGNGELLKHFHSYGIHNFSFPTHIFPLLQLWKGKKLWKSVKPADINNKSTTKVKQNKSLFTFCTFFFYIEQKNSEYASRKCNSCEMSVARLMPSGNELCDKELHYFIYVCMDGNCCTFANSYHYTQSKLSLSGKEKSIIVIISNQKSP